MNRLLTCIVIGLSLIHVFVCIPAHASHSTNAAVKSLENILDSSTSNSSNELRNSNNSKLVSQLPLNSLELKEEGRIDADGLEDTVNVVLIQLLGQSFTRQTYSLHMFRTLVESYLAVFFRPPRDLLTT